MRAPHSLPAATRLLERFALLEGEIGLIEAVRSDAIAKANVAADEAAAALLVERAELTCVLEAWWAGAGPALTGGERKSIELGGCMIGTRADKPSLAVAKSPKVTISALLKTSWGKKLVTITTSLNRRAIAKVLDGAHAVELKELGLSLKHGSVSFVLERVRQEGSRTADA